MTISSLVHRFRLPASESKIGLVLSVCVVSMALLSIAILWQAQVISNQRDTIRFLETVKFGS